MLMLAAVMTETDMLEDVAEVPVHRRSVATKAEVASLSALEISRMSCNQLVDAVRAADLPLLQPQDEMNLEYLDRPVLERLAYLARRCCRNQGY